MFAIRLASASTGISYPYLYLNSAASDCARWASGLASAMAPVMTQPTDCEIWKMCETDEGSMSLSCGLSASVYQWWIRLRGNVREPSSETGLPRSPCP